MRILHTLTVLCTTSVLLSCSQDELQSEGGALEVHRVLELKGPFAVSWDIELDGGSSDGVIQDSQGKVLAYRWDGHTQTLYLGSKPWPNEGFRAIPAGDKKEQALAAILRLYANKYFTSSEKAELERVWRKGGPANLDSSSWTREKHCAVGMLRVAFDIERRSSIEEE